MTLRIETFDNIRGGNALYKALAHPLAATQGRALIGQLSHYGKVAIIDPQGAAEGFAELFDLSDLDISETYVQDVARIGSPVFGHAAKGVTELPQSAARAVLLAAFDADRLIAQLESFLPPHSTVFSLDAMRIPAERLTNPRSRVCSGGSRSSSECRSMASNGARCAGRSGQPSASRVATCRICRPKRRSRNSAETSLCPAQHQKP